MGIVPSILPAKDLDLADMGIKEEKLHQKLNFRSATCDVCLVEENNSRGNNTALYLCYDCQAYICYGCFRIHESHKGRENHNFIKLVSDELETNRRTDDFLRELLHETDIWEKTQHEDISLCDKVDIKHELDQNDCEVYGMCGLENSWVVCDSGNICIKVFQQGSNVLDRYIKFFSHPWDATEIRIKESSLVSTNFAGESTKHLKIGKGIEETSFLAVTLPIAWQILILDLNETPVIKHSAIKTPSGCCSISFSDGKIYTTAVSPFKMKCSISIMTTDGTVLNEIKTGVVSILPCIAVADDIIYIADLRHKCVRCFHMDKESKLQAITEISKGSEAVGISIDNQNIYLCTISTLKGCRLKPGIKGNKVLTDKIIQSVEKPMSICCYRDKIYVSHNAKSPKRNSVTILRCT